MNREGKYICSFILVFFKNKRFKIFLLARSEQVASSVNMQRLQIPLRETCWYAFYGKAVKAIEQWMHAHTHSFGNVLGYTSGSPTSIGHELQQGRPYRLEAGWVIDRDQTQINLCVCVCVRICRGGRECNVCACLLRADNQMVRFPFHQSSQDLLLITH